MNNKGYQDFINVDYKSFCDFLFSFTGNEYAIVASIIGYLISQPLDIDEQNSIGNFFELIGQIMLTISAQNQVYKNNIDPNSNNDLDI